MDLSHSRLEAATRLGADAAELPGRLIADLSEGPGADVAIEAAGDPDSFVLCTRVVRPGGHIANIGTHGKPAMLHLEALWHKNMTISTGRVDTSSTPWLLDLVTSGRLHISHLVTHTFGLDRMEDAYEVFSHGTDTGALKVGLYREKHPARAQSRQPSGCARSAGRPLGLGRSALVIAGGLCCYGSEPRASHETRGSGEKPRTA
ncbi:hypothetical protein GCM10017771_70970 [Streptomyces capitiformicae]|uniref:Alcohol dehydrogenase-like C-terminal domain-containing protein n=1 Tax=Streptomyces capitiformicae TaxID=2014920 RepID=A0A919DJ03_9ACTN|nr:hypothetical protein GCM10017771_70970 [Streptomyces capitiformicae]